MAGVFSVGAKLLGIYMAYLGVIQLAQTIMMRQGPWSAVVVLGLSAAVAFGFAYVLVLRTERLGHLVGIGTDPARSFAAPERREILAAGMILIGLYVVVTRTGMALNVAAMHFGGFRLGGFGGPLLRIALELLPIALAVVLILQADRIAELLTDRKKQAV